MKWTGHPRECRQYIKEDLIIYTNAAANLSMSALVNAATTQLQAAAQTTPSCKEVLEEFICKAAFQPCVPIIPEFNFFQAPCRGVCKQVIDYCYQQFLIGGQAENLPDCEANIPGFPLPLYPPGPNLTLPLGPGNELQIPCIRSEIDPLPPMPFRCERFDGPNICKDYVGHDVFVTDSIGQDDITEQIEPLLEAVASAPESCRKPMEELICKTAFGRCFTKESRQLERPFVWFHPPCKSVCKQSLTQCSTVFALGGAEFPDCNQVSEATGLPSYPREKYDFSPIPVTVSCDETTLSDLPATFDCEPFKGEPRVCKDFIDYDIWVSDVASQDQLAEQATAALEGTSALPPSCLPAVQELVCKTAFRKCLVIEKDDKIKAEMYFGRSPCKSVCSTVVRQCTNSFVIGNTQSPDCNGADVATGLEAYPRDGYTLTAFNKRIEIPCVGSDARFSDLPMKCERFGGEPSGCRDYINGNIFVTELFPQSSMVGVVNQFHLLLEEAPGECKEYGKQLSCRAIFQACKKFDDDFLPVEVGLPTPPCSNVCSDIPDSCRRYFNFVGIPIPDCSESDPVTSQPRYPRDKIQFNYGDNELKVDCLSSQLRHNNNNNNNNDDNNNNNSKNNHNNNNKNNN